jgi:hypothetical protein
MGAVAFPISTIIGVSVLCALGDIAKAQEALSSTPRSGFPAEGFSFAQTNAAIEQSRLLRQAEPPVNLNVDANGNALPESESTTSNDDSFGAQQILKSQEQPRPFLASGGISFIYTDNVALTRKGTRDDAFAVVDAGLAWSPKLANNLEATVGLHAAIFRYVDTTALNFENLGASAGFSWSPPALRGLAIFGRYDFTELLDSDSHELLTEHAFTLGVQKSVSFGRSHGITLGVLGIAGLSDPGDAQRQQISAFLDYRLQLTRKLETDLLVRPAVQFYDKAERTDFNQVVSGSVRYRFNQWADANAFLSYGLNRSERAAFDYGALTTGGGAAINIKF